MCLTRILVLVFFKSIYFKLIKLFITLAIKDDNSLILYLVMVTGNLIKAFFKTKNAIFCWF